MSVGEGASTTVNRDVVLKEERPSVRRWCGGGGGGGGGANSEVATAVARRAKKNVHRRIIVDLVRPRHCLSLEVDEARMYVLDDMICHVCVYYHTSCEEDVHNLINSSFPSSECQF